MEKPLKTIEELEQQIARLKQELVTDELTGLLNRRGLMDALLVLWQEVAYQLKYPENRHNLIMRNLSIVFIDADHFRDINSKYGHDGGDEALKAIAKAIKTHVRGIDVVGRYGGEEIIVGLVGASTEDAVTIANHWRSTIEKMSIKAQDQTFTTTISGGVATLEAGMTLEQLIKKADEALYQAKQSGRNKIVSG